MIAITYCYFKTSLSSIDLRKIIHAALHFRTHSYYTILAQFNLYVWVLMPLRLDQGDKEIPNLYVFRSSTSAGQSTLQYD